jgi:hypothetical protein
MNRQYSHPPVISIYALYAWSTIATRGHVDISPKAVARVMTVPVPTCAVASVYAFPARLLGPTLS